MIRAFIAAEIDQPVAGRILDAIDELRPKISHIRWTLRTNCHLTLKFLGAVEEPQIDAIGAALERELSLFPRCTIHAKGLGVFPDAKRPRILWVGIEGKSLAALAEKVEAALAPLGYEREKRIFMPHLTIGRWREFTRSTRQLRGVLEQWRDYEFGHSLVCEVKLFQSILTSEGARYRLLKTALLDHSAFA
jgi:2'-5' RNA ligase